MCFLQDAVKNCYVFCEVRLEILNITWIGYGSKVLIEVLIATKYYPRRRGIGVWSAAIKVRLAF